MALLQDLIKLDAADLEWVLTCAASAIEPESPSGRAQQQPAEPGSNPDPPNDQESNLAVRIRHILSTEKLSGPDRVLLAAADLTESSGLSEFSSRQVNEILKDSGKQLANVTASLNSLCKRTPKLVSVIMKMGSSPQSQKRYALTESGLIKAKTLIRSLAAARAEARDQPPPADLPGPDPSVTPFARAGNH